MSTSPRSANVQRMLALIEAHSAEPISLRTLAATIGCSTAYLGRQFRRQMGMTFRAYIAHVRIERAAHSIRRGEKIEAVAREVGYRSKKNFYRQFERRFGTTPVSYRATRGVSQAP